MNRTRPSVTILSTGNVNVDLLVSEANQHMEQAEYYQGLALEAEDRREKAYAKTCRQNCIIDQNAAILCHTTARLILDTMPARPGLPVAAIARQYARGQRQ